MVDPYLTQLQETVSALEPLGEPLVLSDIEEMEMEAEQTAAPEGAAPKGTAMRAFRVAGSPSKVANTNLKGKHHR